jgi:hypothetical protein
MPAQTKRPRVTDVQESWIARSQQARLFKKQRKNWVGRKKPEDQKKSEHDATVEMLENALLRLANEPASESVVNRTVSIAQDQWRAETKQYRAFDRDNLQTYKRLKMSCPFCHETYMWGCFEIHKRSCKPQDGLELILEDLFEGKIKPQKSQAEAGKAEPELHDTYEDPPRCACGKLMDLSSDFELAMTWPKCPACKRHRTIKKVDHSKWRDEWRVHDWGVDERSDYFTVDAGDNWDAQDCWNNEY